MNVLLVNSTKNALNAVKKSLNDKKFTLSSVEDYSEALDIIKEKSPQVVLINWGKEDFDIAGFSKKIRKLKMSKYIYIIIIAARERQTQLEKIINFGADDFIFRPFGENELELRVLKARKVILLEDKLLKSKKNLMKFAKEDPLTNLLNRRSLLDEALKEMGRSTREGKYISSIMINVTNFQKIDEDLGGVVSKSVLLEASNRIRLCCRPYDKIGRYGISMFLIILPDTGIKNAKKVAGRIVDSFQDVNFDINNEIIDVHAAIGISEMDPDDVVRIKDRHADDLLMDDLLLDSLIKRSEMAVEKSAGKGKNVIEVIAD